MKTIILLLFVCSMSYPQTQWEKLPQPYGGYISNISILGDTMFASGRDFYYYSTNRGEEWVEGNKNYLFKDFVRCDNGAFLASNSHSVYISKDMNNWLPIAEPRDAQLIKHKGIIFAASLDGSTVSYDNGKNWSRLGMSGCRSLAAVDSFLFIMTYNGLFRKHLSFDSLWVKVTSQSGMHIGKNGNRIYINGETDNIYYSDDYGSTWDYIDLHSEFPELTTNAAIWHGNTLIVSFTDQYYKNYLYYSKNNGKHWNSVENISLASSFINEITYSEGKYYAASIGYGVSVSDNGKKWEPLNKGINELSVLNIRCNRNGIFYALTKGRGIIRSTDTGITWEDMISGLPDANVWQLVLDNCGNIYITTSQSIYRWDFIKKIWRNIFFKDINLSMAANDDYLYANKGNRQFFVSNDKGESWKLIYEVGDMYFFFVDKKGNLFLSIYSPVPKIIRSTDRGQNWSTVYSGKLNFCCPVADEEGVIYYASGTGVIKTTDYGTTWNHNEGVFTKTYNQALYSDQSGSLYLVDDQWYDPSQRYYPTQIYRSDDKGISWTKWATINSHVHDLYFDNKKVTLATEYGILRELNKTNISAINETNTPANYLISQNYPNPFNPGTTIEYSLPSKSNVKIQIFNSLGELKEDLFTGSQSEGTHSIKWTTDLPSGIYFYRIDAIPENNSYKAFSETRKMILLK